ncbi:hypothetical protein LCGC14_0800770 [marine sediment metagenome]|uniref:Uncharacterized protein n=1 Tax=marine sediment metagenome TaxID=412755 RepID=A0A0F9S9N6_9ZZZZ
MKRNQKEIIIDIRLILYKDCEEDRLIFNNFQEIKKELGLKNITEITRYCIKQTHKMILTGRKNFL